MKQITKLISKKDFLKLSTREDRVLAWRKQYPNNKSDPPKSYDIVWCDGELITCRTNRLTNRPVTGRLQDRYEDVVLPRSRHSSRSTTTAKKLAGISTKKLTGCEISKSEFARLCKLVKDRVRRCSYAQSAHSLMFALADAVDATITSWNNRRGVYCIIDKDRIGKITNVVIPKDKQSAIAIEIKSYPVPEAKTNIERHVSNDDTDYIDPHTIKRCSLMSEDDYLSIGNREWRKRRWLWHTGDIHLPDSYDVVWADGRLIAVSLRTKRVLEKLGSIYKRVVVHATIHFDDDELGEYH